jgi:hypothetical protein
VMISCPAPKRGARARNAWIASSGVPKRDREGARGGNHKGKPNRPAAEDDSPVERGLGWNVRARETLAVPTLLEPCFLK